MSRLIIFSLAAVLGCGKKSDPFPYATYEDDENNDEEGSEADEANPVECVDTWMIQGDGVVIQPEVCIAWSPPSAEGMTWYQAASINDPEQDSCGDHCPDGDGHCATLDFDGHSSWRLPTLNELKEAAQSQPDIPDMNGDLWSRKSGQGATENAWVVDLAQPGFWVELTKESDDIRVRCVSDD